ncbi:MAG: hypothetical protein ACW981_17355 [Candidatus Hodarchaeales archaeon]|jgi:hypothetical protein
MNSDRTIDDILALLDLTIDSCLDLVSSTMSDKQISIINRLNHWKSNFKLDNQILHVLEAPMSDLEFKDILKQVLYPIINDLLKHAQQDGIITPEEQKLLDHIITNFEL